MQASDAEVEYLDHMYVYAGTPENLRASGPYSVEAFFKLDTPHGDVFESIDWLIAYKIPHQATVETHLRENGFFLRISFPSEELRSFFVSEYPTRETDAMSAPVGATAE